MAKEQKGAVGKLWTKHGRGYYALVAVGTFLYLEISNLVGAAGAADSVQGFVTSELLTFFIETFLNTLMASFWPLVWYARMGMSAALWAVAGYFVWAFLLALLLSKREAQMRKELGLD